MEMPSIEELESLPLCYRKTIPAEYIDLLGHMNVSHYFSIFGNAAMSLMSSIGMTPEYITDKRGGNFVLRQVIDYLAEVLEGDTVAVRGCVLGRSEKRLHKIYFMVNETKRVVASTSEVLASHADLNKRRTSPFPAEFAVKIDGLIAERNRLTWNVPTSGIIHP